jgi:hypothetical protein
LGGYPVGRDRWGGKRAAEGCLPRINIGADVAGTPWYCRAITLNTGKLISFANHHSSGSVLIGEAGNSR